MQEPIVPTSTDKKSVEVDSEGMTITKILGRNVTMRRKVLGMTQKDLSIKLGISRDAMNSIEKGKFAPRMSRVQEIADILGCSVSFLFKDNNPVLEQTETIVQLIQSFPEDEQKNLVNFILGTVQLMTSRKISQV